MKEKIIISGAGLVGSLWAILLAKRGYQIEVYERRPDMRKSNLGGGRSINLALSTRGWKALQKAGIDQDIKKIALPMKGRMMHDTQGNLTFQAYGKEDQAIYSVSRGELNKKLMDLAESHDNVSFYFNKRTLKIDTNNCDLHLFDEDNKEKLSKSADFIFGADGAFSAIRNSLQKTPLFNYSQSYLEHGYKELTIPATSSGDYALDHESLHIWPRGQFMLIALPNLDKSFTCTLFLPFQGEESFEKLKKDKEILLFFNKYFKDAVPLMPSLLEDFKENPNSSLVTIKCNPWQYKEKILLMGDASHAIVPFYGQGMNSGFEDCSILDEMADEYQEDWATIFRQFSKTRPQDANGIADLAIRNFIEMRDLVGDPMFLLRKKIAAWLYELYPNDFMPLYSMVTFSHINYYDAWIQGNRQDELFEKILAIPNIENDWKNDRVIEVFEEWKNNS